MTYKKTASILTILISLGLTGFPVVAGAVKESKIIKHFDYRDINRIVKDNYTWQCPYVLSDEKYNVNIPSDSPLVDLFEVDEKRLYIKVNSKLIKMNIKSLTGNHYIYLNKRENIEVDLKINKKYNFSEYDESHDRKVKITIKTVNGIEVTNAIGQSCGI
nr:hypothetical protein [uncultured Tolumonas sp.]